MPEVKKTEMFGGMQMPSLDGWSTFIKPQAKMAEALIKQNIETLEFLKTRFEKDREVLESLSEAADATEAMGIWQGFWQRMLTDYSAETNKLATSATEIAEQAIRSATEEGAALMASAKDKK